MSRKADRKDNALRTGKGATASRLSAFDLLEAQELTYGSAVLIRSQWSRVSLRRARSHDVIYLTDLCSKIPRTLAQLEPYKALAHGGMHL
jgi:hypothetical protein